MSFLCVDLTKFMEEEKFNNAFCSSCPKGPHSCDGPEEDVCPRSHYWEEIKEVLKNAEYDIIDNLRAAGCTNYY
ncbi:MAG: hypothetical protein IJR68_04650 [Fretibacterium sp.]|nr:hypothetical protein [Fretibacterium sp.]